jgi:hypothetical protein
MEPILRQDKHTPGKFTSWRTQKGNVVEFWDERRRLTGTVERVSGDALFIRSGEQLFERHKEQVRRI